MKAKLFKIKYVLLGLLYAIGYPIALILENVTKTYEGMSADGGKVQFKWPIYSRLAFAVDLTFCQNSESTRKQVFAIALNESGSGTSKFAKEHNNYFGMSNTTGYYAVGQNTEVKESDGSKKKKYLSIYESVFDFYLYAKYRQPVVYTALNDNTKDWIYDLSQTVDVMKSVGYFSGTSADKYTVASISSLLQGKLGKVSRQYLMVCLVGGTAISGVLTVMIYKWRKNKRA